ncbi:MAG: glycosyltransferase family 4 protein [Candidatus Omnitrophica bacterium]|nr:glycosyltransferase family 4 protein [Candidatus Omnitrophota bacterium]
MNSYTKGYSGGDICLIELLKRMVTLRRVVITSGLGKKLCLDNGLEAEYLLTTVERRFINLIGTYMLRIIRSFFLKLKITGEDILYASSDFLTDVIPVFFRKKRRPEAKWAQKVFHIIPASRPIPHYAQKISFFLIRRMADIIIVDNSILKEELIRRNFPADKIRLNYPGIDLDKYPVPSDKRRDMRAVFLGRFHYSKGLFELVEIWQIVCRKIPQAKLTIIGGGNEPLRSKLTKKINRSGMNDNIILTGRIDKEKIIEAMSFNRVFVFPSHEEGFGIAIAEAMACGLAVVAWDLAVYKEIFGDFIIRVKENDISSFAAKVIGLLEDENSRFQLSQQSREYVKRYSWDNAAKKELEFLSA